MERQAEERAIGSIDFSFHVWPVARDRARHQRGDRHPLWQGIRTGRRIRTPGRPAEHAEPVETQRIGQCGDIARPVDERPAGLRVRTPDARSVRRDQPHSCMSGHLGATLNVEPAREPAVAIDHRHPSGFTVFVVRQTTLVWEEDEGEWHVVSASFRVPSPGAAVPRGGRSRSLRPSPSVQGSEGVVNPLTTGRPASSSPQAATRTGRSPG